MNRRITRTILALLLVAVGFVGMSALPAQADACTDIAWVPTTAPSNNIDGKGQAVSCPVEPQIHLWVALWLNGGSGWHQYYTENRDCYSASQCTHTTEYVSGSGPYCFAYETKMGGWYCNNNQTHIDLVGATSGVAYFDGNGNYC